MSTSQRKPERTASELPRVPMNPAMFSPASFFDVLEMRSVASAAEDLGEPDDAPGRPAVVAFYGFRGGAGRTLALAHVAVLLARRGAKVVAVDLDLEAPGLDVVLGAEGDTPDADTGAIYVLRETLRNDAEVPDIKQHLRRPTVVDGPGQLWVLPAGALTRRYLAALEELGVASWHLSERHPVRRMVDALAEHIDKLDAVLLDCRTGLSAMSASVLFHVADVVVVFTPVSEQAFRGLDILLQGLHSSRALRNKRPALLLVPGMVALGGAGSAKLDNFKSRVHEMYDGVLQTKAPSDREEVDDLRDVPWLQPGVRYDGALAVVGRVDRDLEASTWGLYVPLADAVATSIGFLANRLDSPAVDSRAILKEIHTSTADSFAETTDINKLIQRFVRPADYSAAIDRSTTFVIGAKGAGKTWLWRYLLDGRAMLDKEPRFIVGHAPENAPEHDSLVLSPDALKELEKEAEMVAHETHRAFWRLYGVRRAVEARSDLGAAVAQTAVGQRERTRIEALLSASNGRSLLRALLQLLALPNVGTLSETMLGGIDSWLLQNGEPALTLAYDGLDTGFGTGGDWEARRSRFTEALVQVAGAAKPARKVFFKLFVREDMWAALNIQNQSHLAAAAIELRWRPSDLWRMALNTAMTSGTYSRLVRTLEPGVQPPWNVSDETLVRLLEPLWGSTVERGKLAKTINYVQKRTMDASERLFPRTLAQVLDVAVNEERKKSEPLPDRVIRFTSLREGIRAASRQRVTDLMKEYVQLELYLELLRGAPPTWTRKQFVDRMAKRFRAKWSSARRGRSGAAPGSLHAGPGGWGKVIEQLRIVGVIGPYSRGSTVDEEKFAVALLYRYGLDIPGSGLT